MNTDIADCLSVLTFSPLACFDITSKLHSVNCFQHISTTPLRLHSLYMELSNTGPTAIIVNWTTLESTKTMANPKP